MIQFRSEDLSVAREIMNLSFSLYRLQVLDTQRQKINQRLTQIDAILAADETIKASLKAKSEAEQAVKEIQSYLKDLGIQAATKRMKLELNQNQLFGGKVRNPKDLQDLQKGSWFPQKINPRNWGSTNWGYD